jgi:hypothetical protein
MGSQLRALVVRPTARLILFGLLVPVQLTPQAARCAWDGGAGEADVVAGAGGVRGWGPGPDWPVGWPRASQPGAPTDPYVTISRHTALVALVTGQSGAA